jgi:eukaryotic-like serine/threonine-protein kinase
MNVVRGVEAPPPALAGDVPPVLGDYTLLTKLASGGMATVYLGHKSGVAGFERFVAIKRCHPHLGDDDEFVTMFLDEARLAARIHHPNVVSTLDVECNESLYLVMDYVEGDSLGSLLRMAGKNKTKIPVEVAVRVMIDALLGLHAAHELRDLDGELLDLVHRDVSPQNILVGIDGVSRITDFGIAFAAARSTVTQAGRIKGKFSYMAPEQVKGQTATRRIDVFGAGIVLWESLAGRPLFRRQDDAATINAVLTERVLPPSALTPGIPKALDEVVLKALRRNPDERHQTAAEFADALEQLSIPRVSSRSVAAYLETAIGPKLAERRTLVRNLLEQEQQALHEGEPPGSDVHPRALRGYDRATRHSSITSPSKSQVIDVPDTTVGSQPKSNGQVEAPGEIEHRRMRGLLAAAMLLMVGSAVGLLLARMNSAPPSHVPAPSQSAVP